jgi:hypothetical protein
MAETDLDFPEAAELKPEPATAIGWKAADGRA